MTIISVILAIMSGLFGPVANGPETPVAAMNACTFEDGSESNFPCVWDATKHGNGTGQSFFYDADGTFHFLYEA